MAGKVGRPLKFETEQELTDKINEYFQWCDNRTAIKHDKEGNTFEVPWPRPYTLSGLAMFLDCDRQTLLNYSKKEEYFGTISRARRRCENYAEEQLFEGNDRGSKFTLINNYNWKERQEIDHNVDLNVKIVDDV